LGHLALRKLKEIPMKYLPLLVLGLMAAPAFADDLTARVMPIPNETTATARTDALCLATADVMVKKTCALNDPKLVLVDDVNVPVKPLSNETAIAGAVLVDLVCVVKDDASVNDCQLADGAKVSKQAADTAIAQVNGKVHMTGAYVVGNSTHVVVSLHVGKAMPWQLIR
jgi:hypothetical protein